jgi:hypothetical protein
MDAPAREERAMAVDELREADMLRPTSREGKKRRPQHSPPRHARGSSVRSTARAATSLQWKEPYERISYIKLVLPRGDSFLLTIVQQVVTESDYRTLLLEITPMVRRNAAAGRLLPFQESYQQSSQEYSNR